MPQGPNEPPDDPKISDLERSRAERDYPVALIEPEALSLLQRSVIQAAIEANELEAAASCLGRLIRRVKLLEDLARDAHGYVTGDPNAEARFARAVLGLGRGEGLGCEPDGEDPRVFFASLTGLPLPALPRRSPPCLFLRFGFDRFQEGLLRLAQGIAATGNEPPEEVLASLNQGLEPLTEAADRLELIYAETRQLLFSAGGPGGGFARFAVHLSSGEAGGRPFPQPGEPRPFPFPRGFDFDPCRLERGSSTERAVRCFCRESYVIESIVNLESTGEDGEELVGEGCPGQLIEIRGRGFLADREWPIGGASEVIFSGGRDGVPVAAGDYVSWSDTEVQVRVPEAARSGPISMRILCRADNIGECGIQLRPPLGLPANRSFFLPPAPGIERFTAPESYPWCTPASLSIRVTDAAEVTLRDDEGRTVAFPEGEAGARRTVEGTVMVTEPAARTYTLTARNACAEASASRTVRRERNFPFRAEGNVPAGEDAVLILVHHCTPESLGRSEARFDLSFEDPDGVLAGEPPSQIIVRGGESEARLRVRTTRDTCGLVGVTATPRDPSAYDWEASYAPFAVYSAPVLNSVSVVGADACDPFRFELACDCVISGIESPRVHLARSDTGARQTARIEEIRPGSPRPSQGVVVVCEAPAGLGEHRYLVSIEQFGQRSNERPLTPGALRMPRLAILDFDSAQSSVHGAARPRPNLLTWTVRSASRVELWVSGGQLDRGPGVIFEDRFSGSGCDPWSGRYEDRIGYPLTYELRAYPIGGGARVTRTIEITDSSRRPPPRDTRGFRSLRLMNCDPDRHELRVWTRAILPVRGRWQERGRLAHGYDGSGGCPRAGAPSVEITFDDGVLYELQLVDPAAPTCGGNDPGLVNCWRLNPPAYVVGDEDGLNVVWSFGLEAFPI